MSKHLFTTFALAMLLSNVALAQESLHARLDQPESVRLRGGFSFNGGGGFGVSGGGATSLSLRLGVQFTRAFSLYYQATPMAFLAANDGNIAAGLVFGNGLLANVTLGDAFEIGLGPSLDYSTIAGCAEGIACDAVRGVEFGAHGRLALNLGGRNAETGRRSGFSIGVDVHPIFTPAGTLLLTTAGIGGECF